MVLSCFKYGSLKTRARRKGRLSTTKSCICFHIISFRELLKGIAHHKALNTIKNAIFAGS
jgi:hypothetical protein